MRWHPQATSISRWRLRGIIGMSRSTGSERAVMARR
jgi:hypothetical protein